MPRIDILNECRVFDSPKTIVLRGLMDYPESETTKFEKSIDVDLPEKWNIGLIVGPSGSGKTTIAKKIFNEWASPEWGDSSIFDEIKLGPRETAELLSSVGLSSVPAWLRPRKMLSGGEGFRADVAKIISTSNNSSPVVIDEFTSVVDRQVAKSISVCISRFARRENRQFVCVSCHYDILDWLQPDWVIDMANDKFYRRSLRRRPNIDIDFARVSVDKAWPFFKPHHYMSGEISSASIGWCFYICGAPVAFASFRYLPHQKVKNMMIASRIVVLPDFQGLGIGRAITDVAAIELKKAGYRVRVRTAHPGMQRILENNSRWRFCGANRSSISGASSSIKSITSIRSFLRAARSYEFVGNLCPASASHP